MPFLGQATRNRVKSHQIQGPVISVSYEFVTPIVLLRLNEFVEQKTFVRYGGLPWKRHVKLCLSRVIINIKYRIFLCCV